MPDIQITGVHYHVSDRLRSYIEEKIGALQRFSSDLTRVHVTIHEGDKFGYRVDVEMHTADGMDVIAHDNEETVYSAVDVVADKCSKQLRRAHSKQLKMRKRNQDRTAMPV